MQGSNEMTDINQATLKLGNEQKPWSSGELGYLRQHASEGAPAIAEALNRSIESVKNAARRNRISLRREGEKRGLLLGQPKHSSWMDLRKEGISAPRLEQIRQDALAGLIDLGELERQIADIAKGKEPEICPQCTTRYIQRAATGLCAPCHLKILARLHQDAVDQRNAERQLWAARQENSRNRRRDNEDED